MKEIIENLTQDQLVLITAPPGWGKTYKILSAIKDSVQKVVFLFPLRALCDEVYFSALKFKITAHNLKKSDDLSVLKLMNHHLLVATPEVFTYSDFYKDHIFILDEFHLYYYWGDTFRNHLLEFYYDITSRSCPLILLTATLSEEHIQRLSVEQKINYQQIFHLDFGNQVLKNYPNRIFYYPKMIKSWMEDDILYADHKGTCLIFCEFREQVK